MTPPQRRALVDDSSASFVGGAFQFTLPSLLNTPELLQCFHDGGGIAYADLGEEIVHAIDLMHRPWFDHLLTEHWLPQVGGLAHRLGQGARVLDVGCGRAHSSIAMAQAYPRSKIVAIDVHQPCIALAQTRAKELRLQNLELRTMAIEEFFDDRRFDLILAIDCVHDMPDPVGSLKRLKQLMQGDSLLFWSEPKGSHNPLENRTPAGRMRATLSLFHCLTVSLASGGPGLGTIIGEKGARELAESAGFTKFDVLPIEHPMQQFYGLRTEGHH